MNALLWLNRWMWGGHITVLKEKARQNHMCDELNQLRQDMNNVPCGLKNGASKMVFGSGQSNKPDLMIIGEAPGAEEDNTGLPFVGRSGKLIDEMLFAMQIERSEIYITNILPWKPPGNRAPTPDEMNMMMPYVLKHINIVQPKVILLLGSTAARGVLKLDKTAVVGDIQGRWFQVNGIPTIVTYHPSYLMRLAIKKRDTWQALCMIMDLWSGQGADLVREE